MSASALGPQGRNLQIFSLSFLEKFLGFLSAFSLVVVLIQVAVTRWALDRKENRWAPDGAASVFHEARNVDQVSPLADPLFVTEDKLHLRRALGEAGMEEVRFRFDFQGTSVVES